MITKVALPVFIDTDNACGSRTGDIDDAFAIAALFAADIEIAGVCSVYGNTSAKKSLVNTGGLASLFNEKVPLLAGADNRSSRPEELAAFFKARPGPLRYAALGPLTNLAYLYDQNKGDLIRLISEIVLVGANTSSLGAIPPLWPHEFNLTKDLAAAKKIFAAPLPLTICPLNIVKKLTFDLDDIARMPEPLYSYFSRHAKRWILRNRCLKARSFFPVWDLAATMYLLEPHLFTTSHTTGKLSMLGKLQLGTGNRPLKIITGFDSTTVKTSYFKILCSRFKDSTCSENTL